MGNPLTPQTDGFGLTCTRQGVFYNARYYDPALGRFAQADSLIPGGAQGLDRYAYVTNNPIRYTDPSGHRCQPANECERVNVSGLTHAGDKAQTEDGQEFKRRIGGAEVYKLFLQYRDTCGWWNSGCAINFGLEEFLGLWIYFESNRDSQIAGVLSTIIAQNLYVGGNNPAVCSPKDCFAGVFNFIASYSNGRGGLFGGPSYAANETGTLSSSSNLSGWGKKALDMFSIVSPVRDLGPSNWGNRGGWGDALKDAHIPSYFVNGLAVDTVYFYTNNAIYYSISQQEYWKNLGVDMKMDAEGETLQ